MKNEIRAILLSSFLPAPLVGSHILTSSGSWFGSSPQPSFVHPLRVSFTPIPFAAQREGREPTGRTRSESGREVSDRHAERRGGRRECKTEPHVVPLSLRFGSLRPLVLRVFRRHFIPPVPALLGGLCSSSHRLRRPRRGVRREEQRTGGIVKRTEGYRQTTVGTGLVSSRSGRSPYGSFPSRCDCKEREYEGNGMSDRTEQITSACF